MLDPAIRVGRFEDVLFQIGVRAGRETDKVGKDNGIAQFPRQLKIFSGFFARHPQFLQEKFPKRPAESFQFFGVLDPVRNYSDFRNPVGIPLRVFHNARSRHSF